MNRGIAFVVATSIVAGMLTGCAASVGGVECEFRIHNVHRSSRNSGWMDVKATGSCNGNADWATVTIGYQKKTSKGWKTIAASVAKRIIDPVVAGRTYTVMSQNYTRCVPGTYRGIGSGTITLRGKTYPPVNLGAGPSSKVSC